MSGRVPLLSHEKALVISTTLFQREDYPGIKKVEHVYFYGVPVTDDETRRDYLDQSYRLGRDFAA